MGIPKILILVDPPQAKEVLAFDLEARLGIELLDPRSEAEAVGLLVTGEAVDLVVVDPAGGWGGFLKYAESGGKRPQFVVVTSPGSPALPEGFDVVANIERKNLLKELPQFLSDFLLANRAPDVDESTDDREYCRIKTQLLLEASPLKADVYIRLSDRKFIKLFHKGTAFEYEDLDKYLEKKQVRYLYIKTADTGEFLGKFEQMLQAMLQDKNLTAEKGAVAAARALDTVHEMADKMGFTPEVEQVFKSNVALVMKIVSKNVKLATMLADLVSDRSSYVSAHSVALARVSCAIAAEMDWKSESTFQKLTTAAMLHDIVLRNQKLAQIRSMTELKQRADEFTSEEVASYPNHPIQAADLARSFSDMPADVDQIIQQHHELPDGRGFPKGLSATRISPLASLFIIAHDLVDEAFEGGDGFTLERFVESRKGIYETRNFKKVMSDLPKARIVFKS